MRKAEEPIRRAFVALALVTLLGAAGCGESRPPPAAISASGLAVGSYKVYVGSVPQSVLNAAFVNLQPDSIVMVGTTPPYTVAVQELDTGTVHKVGSVATCSERPSWTGIQGPYAVFFCETPTAGLGEFGLVDATSLTLRVYPVRGNFPQRGTPVDVKGLVVDRSEMYWWVYLNAEPSHLFASGALNLASGSQTAIPATFGWGALSPNDSLFKYGPGHEVFRWRKEGRWIALGTEAQVRGASWGGVDDSGAQWAVAPTANTDLNDLGSIQGWRFTFSRPGSPHVRTWLFSGAPIAAGPGFVVFESHSGDVHILFPLERRTVSISGLTEPTDSRIATGTVAGWFRTTNPAAVVVLSIKAGHLEEIEILSR